MEETKDDSPEPRLPPPPNPSADTGMVFDSTTTLDSTSSMGPAKIAELDVFELPPIAALKLLCGGIEALVRVTGDVPPTPPPEEPTTPNMRGMQLEKEKIVRTNSMTDLTKLQQSKMAGNFDGVLLKKPMPSEDKERPRQPHIIIGENAEPVNMQHSAITRKFYSKALPGISLEDYLMRIHKFCPLTTCVYLATSVYIHRLAVEERAIPVTRRNCHRLVLAGLRIAMKALEDLSYEHARFSKVGGVSGAELARLEISFCFLTSFELYMTKEVLQDHAMTLRKIIAQQGACNGISLQLKAPLRAVPRRTNMQKETLREVAALS